MRTHRGLIRSVAVSAICVGAPAAWAAPHVQPKAESDLVDVDEGKPKLKTFTDGKGHYIALAPAELTSNLFFYGSSADLYQQRGFGGGRSGDEAFNRSFWDPRQSGPLDAEFRLRDHKYLLSCGKRETEFTAVPEAETKKLLDAARFHRPRWKHQSYWLARDERGNYLYIDRLREPPGNTAFRVWFGPKGALKAIKLTNIVSDSKGDVFSTKDGQIRLVSNGSDGKWIRGRDAEQLVVVPIEDNHQLVYSELGVYLGEKLGTACDDL